MSKQLSFEEYQPSIHKMEIYLIADGVRLIENIAAFFRLADAMGVRKIFFTERKESYRASRLKKISRSTSELVPAQWDISREDMRKYVPKNAIIIALEYTLDSYPIAHVKADLRKSPLVLVLGSEVNGISTPVLQQADQQVHLPMFGKNSSMNVSMAAAMALYELIREPWK